MANKRRIYLPYSKRPLLAALSLSHQAEVDQKETDQLMALLALETRMISVRQ